MHDTTPITFRIDTNLKRKLDAAAAADYRSTASLLNSIIARYLDGAPNLVTIHPLDVQVPAEEPEVTYRQPRGRPKTNAGMVEPIKPAFVQWLDKRERTETISLSDVTGDFFSNNKSDDAAKALGARSLLVMFGYKQLIATYADGSEEEIWRKSA